MPDGAPQGKPAPAPTAQAPTAPGGADVLATDPAGIWATALEAQLAPLTADGIVLALTWNSDGLDCARTDPGAGGALTLRHVPPDGYTAAPRHDVLRPDQAGAVTGRKKPHVSVRGPIQPVEAEVLLRVWGDGGVNTGDAAQRQALEDLVAADMVTRGDMSDVLPDRVAYSLRMLSEPSPPTDTPIVPDHWHLAPLPLTL
ncbi:hypothetical protein ACFTXM_29750 [Streptomyces sp. NPDC056930]|uniref:hypothetical protein n=1 Tax=Streptomyces sp. NPDC056930 TaxID=3345967 RepID=UPI003632FE00